MKLPEDISERCMFDHSSKLYGSSLAAMAASLTTMSQTLPKDGSFGKVLAIFANECAAAAAEIDRLRRDCSEAYQASGALAYTAGWWKLASDHPWRRPIEKLLDNLSAAAEGQTRPHEDLLPFALDKSGISANAEIQRLKAVVAMCVEALGLMIYETTHLSPLKENGSHDCNISKYALEKARAARDAAKEIG